MRGLSRRKLDTMKTSHENEKFCSELESYVQLYNQKSGSISQGLSFYAEFSYRVNDVYQKASDLVMARDIEKNEIINTLNGGSNNNYNKNPSPNDVFNNFNLLNPVNNAITNMDYQYHYNYQPNNNAYSNNNPNKSSTTYNLNPSQQQNYQQQNYQQQQNYNNNNYQNNFK